MLSRLRDIHLFPFVALLVALLYYGPFLNNFFAFDDFKYLENMYRGWVDVLLGYGSFRLISNLSWWPLFHLSGFDPFGYNLLALLLYVANGILLYFLLIRLLSDRALAFLASLFFVTGSAGADAVFWKATNSSLFSLFFYLSSLIFYVKFRQSGEKRCYRFALLLFLSAMFSKEEAASLPLTAALIDVFFFEGGNEFKALVRRILPFFGIVVFYVAANVVTFNLLLGGHAEPEKLFRFRPLYSLIGGGTAFFLSPDGFLRGNSPPVYLTCIFLVLALLLRLHRRLLLFGLFWVFLAFLPQSLTGLGQLEPKYLVNSISRYLYITSIGSSIVFAAVMCGIRNWVPPRMWILLAGAMIILYVWVHYPQVKTRGMEWQSTGEDMQQFLVGMKESVPFLPSPTYLHVVNRPTGRAFVQQALQAWYGNTEIHWEDDLVAAKYENKSPLYVVIYQPVNVKPVVIQRLN